MVTRPRCSECRKTFTPSPRAGSKQKACSAKCSAARERRLARARRRRDIEAYRNDELERQHASRRKQAEAARGGGSGDARHAEESAPKSLETQDKVVEIVVRVPELSRGTIVRVRSLKRLPALEILVTG
jgi:hypothetical protein